MRVRSGLVGIGFPRGASHFPRVSPAVDDEEADVRQGFHVSRETCRCRFQQTGVRQGTGTRDSTRPSRGH